ncbi:hypothetical protein [Nocardioides sp.]|uniref:hypothetical protein n=1 Tax=Nocardioides sp. TaxID=35761 RepID=UPI002621A46F|nr:hypothetical protein [Nocardioides sp.]MCW2737468.1 hypothetical protein [Nocardioides sp.]
MVLDGGESLGVGQQLDDAGGGYWDLRGDVSGPLDVESWLGEDAGAAIRACAEKTGVTELVLAYPASQPG